jgi:hypothetical protein
MEAFLPSSDDGRTWSIAQRHSSISVRDVAAMTTQVRE